MELGTGRLFVVATPIGNLQDVTLRALEVLRGVDVLAAEDAGHTRKLFSHFDIPMPRHVVSYREENRERSAAHILDFLREGLSVALVTDAGTPAISDPGDYLVDRCHAEGVPVVPIPGASASLAALAASGLPSGRFAFEGFLPRKGQDRKRRLQELSREPRTMIIYEAPNRVADTLRDLAEAFGPGRRACVARELTKKFEEIRRDHLHGLSSWAGAAEPRGEFVFIVEGAPPEPPPSAEDADALMAEALARGATRRAAAKEVAERLGLSARDLYNRSLPD